MIETLPKRLNITPTHHSGYIYHVTRGVHLSSIKKLGLIAQDKSETTIAQREIGFLLSLVKLLSFTESMLSMLGIFLAGYLARESSRAGTSRHCIITLPACSLVFNWLCRRPRFVNCRWEKSWAAFSWTLHRWKVGSTRQNKVQKLNCSNSV